MTDLDTLKIEPLGKHHDRAVFSCGFLELDRIPFKWKSDFG